MLLKGAFNVLFILFLLIFSVSSTLFSQDSISNKQPKKAAILSLCLPGAGQVYNQVNSITKSYKAYWKVPLIYSVLGISSIQLLKSITTEKELRNTYYNRENGIFSDKWAEYSQDNILILHSSAKRNRDLLFISTVVLYLFQVADASIEAHFNHFDLSPNLSLNISPMIMPQSLGLNLNFSVHKTYLIFH